MARKPINVVDAALMALRMSVEDVASSVGVARPTLVSYSRDERSVPTPFRIALARVLRERAAHILSIADQLES